MLRAPRYRVAPNTSRRIHRQADHRDGDDCRRAEAAEFEAAGFARFGQQIAQRRAQRARQHESRPEQQIVRRPGEEPDTGHNNQKPGEHSRGADEAKAGVVSEEIAQRSAERIGKQDREPVKGLRLARDDTVHGNRPDDQPPRAQRQQRQAEQKERTADISNPERAIREIRHRRADRCRSCDDRPVKRGMQAARG